MKKWVGLLLLFFAMNLWAEVSTITIKKETAALDLLIKYPQIEVISTVWGRHE